MDQNARIFVAGHSGMVGSAIVRKLLTAGHTEIITHSRSDLDLTRQQQVDDFFADVRPEYVFLAAAKVGGIQANNTFRADFLYQNLMIEANVISAAHRHGTTKLLFLGSSCIYPKFATQPMTEDQLLTDTLEKTNEPYAIAKIAGIKLCEAYWDQYGCQFISAMPTNLYGPRDNYDLENSHVLPALLRKFHEAKKSNRDTVTVWGSGSPLREFLHVDDLANACYLLMQKYSNKQFVNVGSEEEISIKYLAQLIAQIVDFKGQIIHDLSKPDGTPRKLMDSSKIKTLGWKPQITLADGIARVYSNLEGVDWW